MTTRTTLGLLLALGWLIAIAPLCAQEAKPPSADEIKLLLARYQAERDTAIKTGVAERFLPAMMDRADGLAKKAATALAAGRLGQAAEAVRHARWEVPYQAPGTPEHHVARILGSPRMRHSAPVFAIAFSPDGLHLASASADKTVKLWDLGNGHEVRTYDGHDDWVYQVAFSADGLMIASAGADAIVKIWDPATGKERHTLKVPACKEIRALAFGRDGKHLFAGFTPTPGKSYAGALACIDVATGAIKRTDSDFRGPVSSLSFSPDGTVLAVSDTSGQVRLWQYSAMVANPKQPAYWAKQHTTGAILAVAFSPDGQTLACSSAPSVMLYKAVMPGAPFQPGNPRLNITVPAVTRAIAFAKDGKALFARSDDGMIRFWDPESGQPLGAFKEEASAVYSLAFNPSGNQLAWTGADYVVQLRDFDVVLAARDLARHDGPIWSAAFSPEGDRIVTASADRTVRVWDVAGAKAILTIADHNGPVTAALFSPDAKYIASVGADKMLRLWDAANGGALRAGAGHTGTITALDISADSKRIITGSADRRIKVWDADTAKELLSIDDNPSLVAAVAARPDGKQIAVGNVDQTVALYDAVTGKLQHRWTAHGVAVNSVAFSPDGQWLASGGNDALVKIWSVARPGVDPVVLAGHGGPVSGVAFRKDSQYLASAGADQLVKLWKLEGGGGKEVQSFRGHRDWVTSVAFNQDGSNLVSSSVDRVAKLWEITSRDAPLFAEHTARVDTVAVSPDGKTIASGGRDRTIKLWERSSGREMATLTAHVGGVMGIVFTPDSKIIVSSGADHTIRLWDAQRRTEIALNAGQALGYKHLTKGSPYLLITPDQQRLLAWFPAPESPTITSLVECYKLITGERLFSFNDIARKVNSLAYCANGNLIATGAKDGSVRLWTVQDNRAEMAPGGDWNLFGKVGVADLALTPDGATLIATSNEGEVKIADIARREVRHTLTAHKDTAISACLVSPDGKRFVTVGNYQVVKCWDLSGQELRQWVVGPSRAALVNCIAFTPDSKQLVTGNTDTTLFVLDLP
jgi:WD40 repeat protein